MTLPRRLLPGDTYLVTRRCTQRQFLLKPEKDVTQLLTYALGWAAQSFGVELHAAIFVSNHYHLVVSDPARQLPRFLQLFNSLVARALNHRWRRQENLWSTQGVSVVRLARPERVWRALVYTITNAVKDGLVSSPEKWTGLRTVPEQLPGLRKKASRPNRFFRQEGTALPESLEAVFSRPPAFEHLSPHAYQQQLRARVQDELNRIKLRRQRLGQGRFLGMKAVLRQSAFATPANRSPGKRLNPALAPGSGQQAVLEKQKLQAWRQAYAECFGAWRAGQRDVSFPSGTWSMVEVHGAYQDGLGLPSG